MYSLWPNQQPESGFRPGFQAEEDYEEAERHQVRFDCPRGHDFGVTFAAGVWPPEWECPRHGVGSLLAERGETTVAVQVGPRPSTTHWEQVLKRRSIPELELLLAERLRHAGRWRPPGHCPPAPSRAAP